MASLLEIGTILQSNTGQVLVVNELLGCGGQGQVYEVIIGNKRYALKWYYSSQGIKKQRDIIERLILTGSPDSRFLWPIDIVDAPNLQSFGYIMEIKGIEYRSMSEIVEKKAELTFRTLCNAAINLVDSYLKLHSKGLCYRDISLGNIFINPQSGDILICDNDNVAVTGTSELSVLGTHRFMAPEIVRGEAVPSTETDLFSLATLLFYMFMFHHPLEGKASVNVDTRNINVGREIYGDKPLFIWDENDFSNRPVFGYHINALIYWDIYPQFIRELFIKAFTKGLFDPKCRLLEVEWRRGFIKLRDSILYCKNCGAENFYDALRIKNGEQHRCWYCKGKISIPPRIKVNDNVILLNLNSRIYSHHIKEDLNFNKVIGEVTANPKNKDILGIKNLSENPWKVLKVNGDEVKLDKDRTMMLTSIRKIDFGSEIGELKL